MMTQVENTVQRCEVQDQTKYAGFWIRLCAGILDIFFVSCLMFVYYLACLVLGGFLTMILLFSLHMDSVAILLIPCSILAFAFGCIVSIIYEPLMLSSKYQATLGMMVINLKIVDTNLRPIGFLRAFLRLLAQIISQIIFYIGYLMIAFTEKKQGLHDMMVGTLVIRD
jgi:uncharacterized RDD family membrane protein YckC